MTQTHAPRHRSRRRRGQDHGAPTGAAPHAAAGAAKAAPTRAQTGTQTGAGSGTPRYLATRADVAGPAEAEARALGPGTRTPTPTPLGRRAAAAAARAPGPAAPLDPATRAAAEQRLGPLPPVHLYRDSMLAAGFGANALTYGGDIHLAPGAAAPGTTDGDRLLGHELTHVAQQAGAAVDTAQFDLAQTDLFAGLGAFHIHGDEASETVDGRTATGLDTSIDFDPDFDSPYSTRIGLVQTIAISDIDDTAARPAPGTRAGPATTSGIAGFDPARTQTLSTAGEGGSDPGWHVDVTNDTRPEHTESEPWYLTSRGPGPDDAFGWNRGAYDQGRASLGDWPRWTTNKDFDFEVAAVAQDTRVLYGVLRWGFSVIDGAVPDDTEYAVPVDVTAGGGTSATYDAALARWRNFYTHEPVAVYFDTGSATPQPGQAGRLADIPGWLAANPDAMVELAGFADTRGAAAANATLAAARAQAARQMLLDAGVPEDRILATPAAATETAQFGAGGREAGTEGNLQANRRALITFRRDRAPAGTP